MENHLTLKFFVTAFLIILLVGSVSAWGRSVSRNPVYDPPEEQPEDDLREENNALIEERQIGGLPLVSENDVGRLVNETTDFIEEKTIQPVEDNLDLILFFGGGFILAVLILFVAIKLRGSDL